MRHKMPPAPLEITNKTQWKERDRYEAKVARRTVKDGYPRLAPFETPEEVYAYLDQELIDCLLCGKRLKALVTHLSKIHHVDTDEYKTRYGLPYGRGLVCASTHQVLQERTITDTALKALERGRKPHGARIQRISGLRLMTNQRSVKKAKAVSDLNRIRWTRAEIERIVIAVEGGATLESVMNGVSSTGFHANIIQYPDLLARQKAAIYPAKKQRALRSGHLFKSHA